MYLLHCFSSCECANGPWVYTVGLVRVRLQGCATQEKQCVRAGLATEGLELHLKSMVIAEGVRYFLTGREKKGGAGFDIMFP